MSGKIGRSGRKPIVPAQRIARCSDTFFHRLNFLLVSEKVSFRRMAEETGICRDSLYYHRRSGTLPSGDQILKLCWYFHVSADWMIGLSDDMSGKTRWRE